VEIFTTEVDADIYINKEIPNTKLVIPEGTPIVIPLFGINRDPQFFSNPIEFKPERFEADLSSNQKERFFIPFGAGPRICIGLRMARMVIKLSLSILLSRFYFELTDPAMTEIEFSPNAPLLAPSHGIHLKVSLCDNTHR
jgi:cytochrome P450 family 6